MWKGLTQNWKQPIFFDYDTPMTMGFLFQILNSLNDISFVVVAILSDMGPTYVRLWKDLTISTVITSLPLSTTKKEIHVFVDVPHL